MPCAHFRLHLAIAQIAALGVIIAGSVDLDPHSWAVQVAAGVAAVLGALLLTWTEKRWPDVQEAQIGVMFILAATAGLPTVLVPNRSRSRAEGAHPCAVV